MSATQRGLIIQQVVRFVDQAVNPNSVFQDATCGLQINERQHTKFTAMPDWFRDTVRVKCKSSGLRYSASHKQWLVSFRAVKLESFDELLLAIHSPPGIYIYRHDLQLGLCKTGTAMPIIGQSIEIRSSRTASDWKTGLNDILRKLNASGCQPVALVRF
eukprot:TRINITY_DN55004_c0_g1_i1.p1 TRINITY_DN55004_c0_g1~~TRINITY_DN55004_c0_g1_i1.p1  ORF type:complete len:159 (-),score=11.12 TRINITY_DN55004_c0_g1_i1:42-518(-)